MLAEIITIGDELLIGDTIDTNASWLAGKLDGLGIDVFRITTISDDRELIQKSLHKALNEVKIVIVTGGLGPTHDDVTKHALAEFFGDELRMDQMIYSHLENLMQRYGKELNNLNRSQAMVPASCKAYINNRGTAPGLLFRKKDQIVLSMPGVPSEMKGLMHDYFMEELTSGGDRVVMHRHLKTFGVPESELAEKLKGCIQELDPRVKMAFLPDPGHVRIRLSARGKREENLEILLDDTQAALIRELGQAYYGTEKDTLEEVVGRELIKRKKTLGTAESCTGGSLSSRITSISGSSAYYLGSLVSYANEVKIKQLGVPENLLEKHGAVSKEVVESMAGNVRKILNSDYALSTSGIAGPDGGTNDKPVGTIWLGLAGPNGITSKCIQLGFGRKANIRLTVDYALDMLRRELEDQI